MFFSSRNGSRPNGRLNASSRPRSYRPMLEVLEDRITPSSMATIPPPASNMSANTAQAVVAQSTAQAANQLTFTFSPDRLIYTAGTTSVKIALTLTDPSGSPITSGTVTFRITDTNGNQVGTPVTVNISSGGQGDTAATATTNQITATYTLPAGLPANQYIVTAVYNQSGSAFDGSQGSEVLTLVLPPAPAQHISTSPSSGPTPAQTQVPGQDQSPPVLSLQQAALTLYISGIERALDTILHKPVDGVESSINAALPFAGPWGSLFEMAGEMAVFNALQNRTT